MNKKILFGGVIVFALVLTVIIILNYQFGQNAANAKIEENTVKTAENTVTAMVIGSISHNQIQKDTSINAIIDSSQKLDNGNLLVKFHHNSNKEEPVSIIGNVRYELSKTVAKPGEEITLTVFD